MFQSLQHLRGHKIKADDGEIGKVADFYFDDESWTVRYMVADTGPWIMGRRVLISPAAFAGKPAEATEEFAVHLTREQVKNGPSIEQHQTVSRQHEQDVAQYYGWPTYWYLGSQQAGVTSATMTLPKIDPLEADIEDKENHLRGLNEVNGYTVNTNDGDVGRVVDILVDDQWRVRYLVVETGKDFKSRKALIAPHWVKSIAWEDERVDIDLRGEDIRNSPEWDSNDALSREYETRLYDYYNYPKYWEQSPH